ncbi:probable chitinase 10 [Battus philenor]|uniref:probable chitinase 10 n=1 Tax=Battus philenor TaxID=42288 RepID=UPI0035D10A98
MLGIPVACFLLLGCALAETSNSTGTPTAKPVDVTTTTAKPANTTTTTAKPVNVTTTTKATTTTTTTKAPPSGNDSMVEVYKPFEGVDPNSLSCDPQGQVFLLLPHFTDCTKFFMCAHGEEVLFVCPGGLYFDFELQVCNWPRDTKCILRDPPGDTDVEGSGEESFDWLSDNADKPSDGSVVSLTAEAVLNAVRPMSLETPARVPGQNVILNCLRADSASRHLPYKGDCQRYWRCRSGVPQVAYCSDGLLFNERSQQCDFEANVQCELRQEDELQREFIAVK